MARKNMIEKVKKMETTNSETPNAFAFSKSSSMKSSMTESNVLLDILLIDFFKGKGRRISLTDSVRKFSRPSSFSIGFVSTLL